MIAAPPNSKIVAGTDEAGFPFIILPQKTCGVTRIFTCAFLLFWLGGWTVGWLAAFNTLMKGGKGAGPFLVFWLCGWTVGGGFAIWTLLRLLRRPVPESLLFATAELRFDTGVDAYSPFRRSRDPSEAWKKIFEKRRQISLSKADLATLKLRDTETDNRLTVDHEGERFDLGRSLSEIEREWLFEQIKKAYSI